MDRRERYDPEDIEILMQERSFDELLEEERAYVLRHVSDRAEYEAMRSLLMHMRDDARDHDPIEADPAIRANVLQAFRNEQQPQWRIWLNSVGAALFPQEAMAMWRPALALGGLALVVVLSVVLVRQFGSGPQELAEIRPAKTAEQDVPPLGRAEQDEREQELETEEPSSGISDEQEIATDAVAGAVREEFKTDHHVFEDAIAEKAMPPAPTAPQTAARTDAMELAETPAMQREEVMTDSETLTRSHVVTADELSRNMSVANATGKVQAKERKAVAMDAIPATTSTSMAENPALLELVAAGW
jgi:hypothetical protein